MIVHKYKIYRGVEVNIMDKLNQYVEEHYMSIKDSITKENMENRKKVIEEITTTDSLLIAIIKGNLIIENKLKDLLVKYGIHENVIEKKYKYFNDKLVLCSSLNIINQDIVNALNKMNSTRNKYGHNINFNITEQYLEDMISTLSANDKKTYEELLKIQGYKKLEGDEKIYKQVITFIEVVYFNLKTTESLFFYKKRGFVLDFYTNILKEINEHNKK